MLIELLRGVASLALLRSLSTKNQLIGKEMEFGATGETFAQLPGTLRTFLDDFVGLLRN